MFYGARPETFILAGRLREHMTPAEVILWTRLRDRKIFDVKFRRQHPAGIYILDFYCHECRLAVEIDGEIHDIADIHENDLNRTEELKQYGIKILRFSNDDIFSDLDSVMSKIKANLTL
jgi:very-short-patch-repair endonuclease